MSTLCTPAVYSPLPYQGYRKIRYQSLVETYIDFSIFRAYEGRSFLCYRMNTIAEIQKKFPESSFLLRSTAASFLVLPFSEVRASVLAGTCRD